MFNIEETYEGANQSVCDISYIEYVISGVENDGPPIELGCIVWVPVLLSSYSLTMLCIFPVWLRTTTIFITPISV